MIKARGQEHQAQGELGAIRPTGVAHVHQFAGQRLQQVRCRQETLVATALADTTLKRRHHQARRGLAHLISQCPTAGNDRALGGVTHRPRVGAGLAVQIRQALGGTGLFSAGQILGLC